MSGIQLTQCYAESLEKGDIIDVTRRPWRILDVATFGNLTMIQAESANEIDPTPEMFRVPKQMIFKIRKTALV